MLETRPFSHPPAGLRRLSPFLTLLAVLAAAAPGRAQQAPPPGEEPLYPPPVDSAMEPSDTGAAPPPPLRAARPAFSTPDAPPAPADEKALPPPPPPPGEEPPTPFDPPGLRAGAFRLHPSIEADGVFTDNLDQTASGKKAAGGLRLAPSIRLKSLWPRHGLTIRAGGEFIQWSRRNEREASASASARLRLDIRRGTYATLETTYDLGEEDAAPARLQHDMALKTALIHNAARLRLTLGLDVDRTVYTKPLSGGASGYDDDYTRPALRLRVSYGLSPALRPYAEIGGDMRLHDKNRDSAGQRRDSRGLYAEAGVELAPDAIWSGSLGLRLALRDYDDPAYKTAHGVGLQAALRWRPTRLTEVKLASTFDIDETTASGASGARKYAISITPRHALRDNLILKGNLGLEYTDYIGLSDHEWLLAAGAEISWILHRGYELVGAWGVERQWSSFAGGDYLENRITLGLRYRM